LNAIFFLATEPSLGKKEVVDPKTSICPLEDDGGCTILPLVDASLSSSIVLLPTEKGVESCDCPEKLL